MTSVRYLRKRPTPRSNKYENKEANKAYYLLQHDVNLVPILLRWAEKFGANLSRLICSNREFVKTKMTRLS